MEGNGSFRSKLNEKVVVPVLNFLKQGMTPHKLALSMALGFVLGLFPVVGITTLLCAVAAFILRINMAAIQLVNYLVYPVQLIALIPLIKLGAVVVGVNPIPYTLSELTTMIGEDFWGAVELLWFANVLGIMAWTFTVIPLGIILYLVLRFSFNRIVKA